MEDCLQHSTQVRGVPPLKTSTKWQCHCLSQIALSILSIFCTQPPRPAICQPSSASYMHDHYSEGLNTGEQWLHGAPKSTAPLVKSGKQGANRNSLNRSRICSREWYISNSAGKGSEAGSTICSTRGGMIVCYAVSVHTCTNPFGRQRLTSKSLRAMID